MEKLKNFLSLKNIEDTQIYKELKCAKNEALILRELCRNYVVSISSINAFTLLSTIFGNDKYLYLDALEDLKKLIERGFVNQNSSFFKSLENNKTQTLTLALLQSELSLSEYFLEFLEAKPRLNFEKQEAYADYLEYLKDEFARIQLYERLSFIQKSAYNSEIKNQIKLYEKHIKERLKKSKFYNVLADIFKEYNLEHKEQIIFLALLKEEYALSNESSISREMNSLLSSESIKEQTAGITQINDSVAQIDQTTKDNVEIANESAIISSTVSDIANNILEDVKKKRF